MSAPWPPSGRIELPDHEVEHWAPEETMDPEQRHEVGFDKLREQIRYCWERSPFYRELWSDAGVFPETLRTLSDLRHFPFVMKDAIRADQAAHPPFGSNLCCPPEAVAHLHGTSGTTGQPTAFAISRDDWLRIAAAHARIMWSFGIRPRRHRVHRILLQPVPR